MGLLDFIAWAARTENPVRASDGTLQQYDAATDSFIELKPYGLSALYIGEVGTDNITIRESVTSLKQELTASGVSNVNFEVYDPGFTMHNSNFFVLDRTVNFNGWFYKIVSVTIHHNPNADIVKVKAEPANVVRLQGDKGAANFGRMSPTTFAAQKAAEFGMTFFGEASPVTDEPILRLFDDTNDESTWDVLKKLANDLEFSLFEGNNTLFFSSDEFIIEKQPVQTVNIPSVDTDELFALTASVRRSVKERHAAQADFKFKKNSLSASLFPGTCLTTNGVGAMDSHTLMIANVHLDATAAGPVSVTTRSTDEPDDAFCTRQILSRGDRGFCVSRMQLALGIENTAEFGPVTERIVGEFQTTNGLPSTGVVDAATWDKIEALT